MISSNNSSNDPFRRFIVNTIVVWPMLGLYMLINHHQPAEPTTVPMPSWVPFYPVFVIPYFGMLLTTWLLPVAIRDPARFRACLTANIIGFLLVTPWWILMPTIIPRPAMPNGAWNLLFGFLWTVDQPYNVMPCAHGIGPMVAAWFVIQDRPAWLWPLVAWLAVGLSSVALTWQHRPVDILLGTVAAIVGIVVVEFLRRKPVVHLLPK
ncbi:MAG TPA: hypothetical protein VK731_05450 [Candidatus Cybelea sp.]|jgi:hypothetical protein|nr:hypothetical protein [Candidatus Cybelea sp.]